jgi:hypothetical protein
VRLAGRSEKRPLRARLPLTPSPDAAPEVAVDEQEPQSDTEEIERVLKDYYVLPDLKALVDDGCDRTRVVALLSLSFLTDESWKALVGMELRQLKTAIEKIKSCADLIDDLNHSELVTRAFDAHDPSFAEIRQPPTLPDRLNEYAKAIEEQTLNQGPTHKTWLDAWKAQLVAMVLEGTGREHDREVSSIIAAVLRCEYSEKAHQAWRLERLELIDQERKRLQQRNSKGIPPPPC